MKWGTKEVTPLRVELFAALDKIEPKSAAELAAELEYTADHVTGVLGKMVSEGIVFRHKAINFDKGGWYYVYTTGPEPCMTGLLAPALEHAEFKPLADCLGGYTYHQPRE